MAKNWAIVVGINRYNPNNFTPLKYAKRDAELMRDFFHEAAFDQVCYFADDSPDLVLSGDRIFPTYPSYGNLLSFLGDRFEQPFLSAGDNCWFFFAGHGGQYANRDYLMPIDANPRGGEPTAAIPVSDVRERLCRCGADNVILILDACRNEGDRANAGIGNEHQQGVITISACSPTQKSWEIDELQQGAFTKALLEALQISGERNCATVERLDQYLRDRIPDLCRRYGKVPEQNPRISADPATKLHFILLPQYATLTDVATLRNEAYRIAFVDGDLDLAEQLCIRAIAAARGRDMEIWKLNNRIQQLKAESSQPAPSPPQSEPRPASSQAGSRSTPTPSSTPEPVRQREVSRPVSNSASSATLPSNERSVTSPTKTIPWGWWLTVNLVAYGLVGFLLAWSSAPLTVWAVTWTWAVTLAGAWAVTWAWAVALAVAWAWAVAVAGVWAVAWAWAVAVTLAGAWAGAVASAGAVVVTLAGALVVVGASEELLRSFSKFHTFLIMMATSGLGLGLGRLAYRVYLLVAYPAT